MGLDLLGTDGQWRAVAYASIASCWRAVLAAAALIAVCTTAGAQNRAFNEFSGYTRGSNEWSGFYVGAGGNINAETATWGFNWTRMPSPSAYVGTSGGSLDFIVGYDQELFRSSWGTTVVGAVADYAVGSSSGRTDCLNGFFDCKTTTSNFFTIRGRLGFAPNNGPVLLYATGGAAGATFVDQKIIGTSFFTPMRVEPLTQGVTTQRWGSVVGGGVEYMLFQPLTLPVFSGSLSAKTELSFIQFPGFNPQPRVSINENGWEWVVSLSYKFSAYKF